MKLALSIRSFASVLVVATAVLTGCTADAGDDRAPAAESSPSSRAALVAQLSEHPELAFLQQDARVVSTLIAERRASGALDEATFAAMEAATTAEEASAAIAGRLGDGDELVVHLRGIEAHRTRLVNDVPALGTLPATELGSVLRSALARRASTSVGIRRAEDTKCEDDCTETFVWDWIQGTLSGPMALIALPRACRDMDRCMAKCHGK